MEAKRGGDGGMGRVGGDMHCSGDDCIQLGRSRYRLGVVITPEAAAWIVVGMVMHQTQLLYSNVFLGTIDLFGVWRWLGRRARISDTAQAGEQWSCDRAGESLFSTATLDGLPVKSREGEVVASSVDALAACAGERIDFLIIRAGGLGGVSETLYRLPWSEARVGNGDFITSRNRSALSRPAVATGG